MQAISHILTLSFSKCKVLIEEKDIRQFLTERIESGEELPRYFGKELDGSIECNEGEFLSELQKSGHIHFYFNGEKTASINYKVGDEDVFELVLSALSENTIQQIGIDDKGVSLYID
ncbi:hypothetical protein GGR22_000393 [Flavobacterium gossypii]|uniref:Uncharacterized protein n=1 Tax=Flavobacterium gossypii TaxID=1646119 RepID=A0ABR6DKR2_9FLAO|nr:hypothetical protein [Flavobacterium gossypii]MBA9072267.1 hypothetical protein [Flavobacterium gossypii]